MNPPEEALKMCEILEWQCETCRAIYAEYVNGCPKCWSHGERFPMTDPKPPVGQRAQLFLDCDGVLADFDSYAEKIFGLPPRKAEEKLGAKRFWCDLQSHDGFYRNLPLMPDARELFEAVKHLNPIILTGLPLGDWAEPQKREWGAKHFPHTTMICCMSADKRNHMKPGDILVDDFLKYKHLWEEAGGIFVHHTSTAETLEKLRRIGVLPVASPVTLSGDTCPVCKIHGIIRHADREVCAASWCNYFKMFDGSK